MTNFRSIFSLGALCAGLLTLFPSTSHAFFNWNSCSPCCNQEITMGADFLWWQPCASDLDFASTVSVNDVFLLENDHVHFKKICPDYDWGVRAFASWKNCDCNWGIRGSYTFFDYDKKSTVRSNTRFVTSPLLHPHLLDGADPFTRAKGEWDLFYQEADILLTHDFCQNQCYSCTPYFGVAGILLHQKMDVRLSDPNVLFNGNRARVEWNSYYKGIGFRAGTGCQYEICQCFQFFAFADGTILVGQTDNENKQYIVDPSNSDARINMHLHDDKCCQFVPGYHLGTGFSYDFNYCGCQIVARLGYEFLMWHNVPNPRVFTTSQSQLQFSHSTSSSTRNLGFQGLFAGLSMDF